LTEAREVQTRPRHTLLPGQLDEQGLGLLGIGCVDELSNLAKSVTVE
jgi:hypothetical protein